MLYAKMRKAAYGGLAMMLVWTAQVARADGIVFIDMHDTPVESQLVLSSPPFSAEYLPGPPCEELPPGLWGPPCIAVYSGPFASTDGSVVRFSAGDEIGTTHAYADGVVLAGFELQDPNADPNDWVWQPIANDWFDSSGAPVRGYIGWGGVSDAGAVYYGWMDVTVTYDPAAEEFSAVLHGLAYQTTPGVPIAAGDVGDFCFGDLDGDRLIGLSDLSLLLANYGATSGVGYHGGNLDADGDVDLADLSLLLSVYGTRCE